MELQTIKRVINDNAEKALLLQNENNYLIKAFFENVFEYNGQTPIRYKGENEGSDNLIIDEGEIIEVRELSPEVETIHSGEKVNTIRVKGVFQDDRCPYENDLMALDNQSIISIFEMFKDKF